jgi:drug/metabolite transporter (DMT)-like permease
MKTEALQTALLSVLVLGEVVSGLGWIAIAVSAIGILVLTVSPTPGAGIATAGSLEGAAYGLGAGALFGLSAVFIRMAATSLAEVDVLSRSLLVLALTTALQLAMLGAYLAATDRKGFATFARKWRPSLAIGTASVASSIGWFTAMTLQNPAYVQALGQVELIFSVMVSRAAFREVPAGREMLGMAIFAGGIILLLLSTQ